MISFIQKFKLNNALKDYLYKLGPALVKRYGQSEQYTVMQIKKTAKSLGLNMRFIRYAVAMYRHQESENTMNFYRIDQDLLDKLRSEMSLALFGYSKKYRVQDVITHGKPMGWRGDICTTTYMSAASFAGGSSGTY